MIFIQENGRADHVCWMGSSRYVIFDRKVLQWYIQGDILVTIDVVFNVLKFRIVLDETGIKAVAFESKTLNKLKDRSIERRVLIPKNVKLCSTMLSINGEQFSMEDGRQLQTESKNLVLLLPDM